MGTQTTSMAGGVVFQRWSTSFTREVGIGLALAPESPCSGSTGLTERRPFVTSSTRSTTPRSELVYTPCCVGGLVRGTRGGDVSTPPHSGADATNRSEGQH